MNCNDPQIPRGSLSGVDSPNRKSLCVESRVQEGTGFGRQYSSAIRPAVLSIFFILYERVESILITIYMSSPKSFYPLASRPFMTAPRVGSFHPSPDATKAIDGLRRAVKQAEGIGLCWSNRVRKITSFVVSS